MKNLAASVFIPAISLSFESIDAVIGTRLKVETSIHTLFFIRRNYITASGSRQL
jgi:hypothetical protein